MSKTTNFLTLLLIFGLWVQCQTKGTPTPPRTWPKQFYSWMVTSVVAQNQTHPLYVQGQLLAYDAINNYTTRFNQQDLITGSSLRGDDYCDYILGSHYRVNDTSGEQGSNPPCAGNAKLGPFEVLNWPTDFLEWAKYLGTDHVNDEYCDHFFMRPIIVGGKSYQMDLWTSVGDQYPCQISIQDIPPEGQPFYITTWAFTGFLNTIPPQVGVGGLARIQCEQSNWVCSASNNASHSDLQQALDWVCGGYVDCTPINPGGSNYYPNTVIAHCDWAFNAYFQAFKIFQGYNACSFGGIAELVPPSNMITEKRNIMAAFPAPPFYPIELVCPALW